MEIKNKFPLTHHKEEPTQFIRVIEEKCVACGDCSEICPQNVWQKVGDIYQPVNYRDCSECGACWDVCEAEAIDFNDPKGGTGVIFPNV
ncbi:MAG: ferredoxin family protein [Candidatus Lokiarchaeia archaeon]